MSLRAVGLPAEDPRTLWGYVGNGARVLVERALGSERRDLLEPALAVFMPVVPCTPARSSDLYPGLRTVIDTLAAEGVVFSLLTNKPLDMSAAIVRGLGLDARFPRVIGGDSLPTKKPDPMASRRSSPPPGSRPRRRSWSATRRSTSRPAGTPASRPAACSGGSAVRR